MEEVIFPAVRDSYADLCEIVQGHDLLVTHPVTFAGPLLAYKTGIDWISSVLSPTSFLSAYDPPVPPFWHWLVHLKYLGPNFMKAAIKVAKKGYQPQAINEFRKELGVPDYGHAIFEGQHSPQMVLALFSPVFARPQPDWPANSYATGFPFYDGNAEIEISSELLQFLDNGPPPLFFTLGSSAVWVGRDFFQQSIRATKALGCRAVLVIGDKRNLPTETLPPDVIAVDYVPFQSVLPRASVMVHHGGVGTTSQGLRAGIPSLIVPFAFDQADNAARAARLGTSRTVYSSQYSADRVTNEITILLTRPDYAEKAKAVSEALSRENGVGTACDLIERVLFKGPLKEKESGEPAYASCD
jgi:UDP:flavonoid glycosyltransferase YjiC (YdhE family)